MGHDRHGDVTHLFTGPGVVSDTQLFDPFGARLAATGPWALPVGFQGDWTDPSSGHVWMGARWYEGGWASFLSRDSVFGELRTPISLNRYTYAWANPLRYWDPDGRYVLEGLGGPAFTATSTTSTSGTVSRAVYGRLAPEDRVEVADLVATNPAPRPGSSRLGETMVAHESRDQVREQWLNLGSAGYVPKPPDWDLRTPRQKMEFIQSVDPSTALPTGGLWSDLGASFKASTWDSWYAHGAEIGDAWYEGRYLDVVNMAVNPAYAALTATDTAVQVCGAGFSLECVGSAAGAVAAVDGLALAGVGGATALSNRGVLPRTTSIGNRLDPYTVTEPRVAPRPTIPRNATRSGPRADFVVGADGTVIPTSASRLQAGFDAAGFPSRPTARPGIEYTLPDGSLVRIMQPSAQAPLRASFTNASGGPISPFTAKPPQPPPGLTAAERLAWVRARTHLELGP